MRIITLLILQLFIYQVFSQEANIDNKWLLILSGYEIENEAIAMKEKYEFETFVLNSSQHDNLNPGWFITCIPFSYKAEAESVSLLLKSKGYDNYIKHSGTYIGIINTKTINTTAKKAIINGIIRNNKEIPVIEYGICWSKNQYPVVEDKKSKINVDKGSFTINITGLSVNTTYYMRTYAINKNVTTYYGNQITFTTKNGLPKVTTIKAWSNEITTAQGSGRITSNGGSFISRRGVCWSINQNPTIKNNKTTDGTGIGGFISNINDLTGNTTYYVRAYATNGNGTAYGNEISFSTINSTVTDYDGNEYQIEQIGNQIWMVENLKATHYSDGNKITLSRRRAAWGNHTYTNKKYCYYNNSIVIADTYGALYTWAAALNGKVPGANSGSIQGACPDGWHLPNKKEWAELIDFIADTSITDNKLTEFGKTSWKGTGIEAANLYGFKILPAGYRIYYGEFNDLDISANYWSTDKSISTSACSYKFYIDRTEGISIYNKANGYSVRCIKD